MLQQTQVATVIPYFLRWMEEFPTVETLARADLQRVLSLWEGLGYYRRARYLHEGAKWILIHGMPQNLEGWRQVPGVGPYTAAAVASIALGIPAELVDGNVERVYARLEGDDASRPELTRNAWSWAKAALVTDSPGDWNQALMELGATICKPKLPACGACPVSHSCFAFRNDRQASLPTPKAKLETVRLTQYCRVLCHGTRVAIRQIPEGEWWHGMWEFPRSTSKEWLIETYGDLEAAELGCVRHSVTSHRIELHAEIAFPASCYADLRWVTLTELAELPMPAPQRRVAKLAARHLQR